MKNNVFPLIGLLCVYAVCNSSLQGANVKLHASSTSSLTSDGSKNTLTSATSASTSASTGATAKNNTTQASQKPAASSFSIFTALNPQVYGPMVAASARDNLIPLIPEVSEKIEQEAKKLLSNMNGEIKETVHAVSNPLLLGGLGALCIYSGINFIADRPDAAALCFCMGFYFLYEGGYLSKRAQVNQTAPAPTKE